MLLVLSALAALAVAGETTPCGPLDVSHVIQPPYSLVQRHIRADRMPPETNVSWCLATPPHSPRRSVYQMEVT